MSGLNPRWLIGKTIAKVELHRFNAERGGIPSKRGGTATDPVITFSDGSKIWFCVQETEVGEYGVEIHYHPSHRKPRRTP